MGLKTRGPPYLGGRGRVLYGGSLSEGPPMGLIWPKNDTLIGASTYSCAIGSKSARPAKYTHRIALPTTV